MREKNWYDSSRSELYIYVKDAILERLRNEIDTIVDNEEYKEDIHAKAEEMVRKIREESEKKIIERVSDLIASMTTGYGGYGLKTMIADIVQEMMQR